MFAISALATAFAAPSPRTQTSFDADWAFHRGDAAGASDPKFDDGAWRTLDVPHDWSAEDLPPRAADVLTVRNCSTNGLAVDDQEWELKSSWQLKHIPSGLCAEAESLTAGSKVKLAECHPIGAEEGDLQQFTNDYTRIRNAMEPMTLSDRQVNYPNAFCDCGVSTCEWPMPPSS